MLLRLYVRFCINVHNLPQFGADNVEQICTLNLLIKELNFTTRALNRNYEVHRRDIPYFSSKNSALLIIWHPLPND